MGRYQGTVKILDKRYCYRYFFFFLCFFDDLLSVFDMVSEHLPNRNDYKLNNKLCDLTTQKRNWVKALQSLALAGLLARLLTVLALL